MKSGLYCPYNWPLVVQTSTTAANTSMPDTVYEACFYAHAADLMGNISGVLQQAALAKNDNAGATTYSNNFLYYTNLAYRVRTNFFYQQTNLKILTDSSGAITNIGNGSQGDFIFPLYFDMVPSTQRVYCLELFLTNSHRGFSNYCDLFGTPPVSTHLLSGGMQSAGRAMLELTRDGQTSTAYEALTNTHLMQWLYPLTNGLPVFQETTIAEHWNSYISGPMTGDDGFPVGGYFLGANSFNHCAFGAVGEWIYKTIAGIAPDDSDSGYKNTIVKPEPGGGVTNCFSSVNQICGPITVSWTNVIASNLFILNVTNPANTSASVYLPTTNIGSITESHGPVTGWGGLVTNGNTVFQVGSGGYSFVVTNITLGQ